MTGTRPTVFDYSAWRPDPNALRAAGIIGVSRYLTTDKGSFSQAKLIRKPEYDALHAAGLSILLNWELSKDRWRSGRQGGLVDGKAARGQARALGHPDSRPIAQSVDTNWVGTADLDLATAYQAGFNDGGGCGPQMLYGTSQMIDVLYDRGLLYPGGWRTASTAWTGNSYQSVHAVLRQRTTKSYPQFPPAFYDENDVYADDWGQWPLWDGFIDTDAKAAATAVWTS